MNNSRFYLPILKSKSGEFTALYNLTDEYKSKISPLFETTPLEYDHDASKKPKTLEEHLRNFCKKLHKKWPFNNCFIDTHLINEIDVSGIECIEFIYDQLANKNILPTPVVRLSTREHIIASIKNILDAYKIDDVCVRLTINDLTSSQFEEKISELVEDLEVSVEQCHILLDLENSDFSRNNDFADALFELMSEFPSLSDWKSFTIAGGAFPNTGKLESKSQKVPRGEWLLYKILVRKMRSSASYRHVNYGDYSIVSPGYFEYDPRKMSRSANIRYTHDDCWFVVKGKALKESKDWQQYYSQAKTIVDSEYYLGENYSFGDMHLKKCSNKKTSTGNPNVWSSMGNNHHFTKVLNDLSAKNF